MKAILAHGHDELPAGEGREGSAKVPRASLEVAAEEVTVKQYEYRMLIDDYMTKQQEQSSQVDKDQLIRVIKKGAEGGNCLSRKDQTENILK
jgi:hypothetical protein